jgi:hypothetical protein
MFQIPVDNSAPRQARNGHELVNLFRAGSETCPLFSLLYSLFFLWFGSDRRIGPPRFPMRPARIRSAGSVAPVSDRRHPLSEVPEALRFLEPGLARGKVVIPVLRRRPASGRVQDPLEAVEDQVEPELELVPVVIAGLHGVLGDKRDQVGVRV